MGSRSAASGESTLIGDVADVTFDNVKYGQSARNVDADLPLVVSGGAQLPHFTPIHNPVAAFMVNPPVFAPGQSVTFTADPSPDARYTWLFGDGTRPAAVACATASPMQRAHNWMDGSGRFRVLLHVEDKKGNQDWAAQGVVAVAHWHFSTHPAGATVPGLSWQIYPGVWTELPNLAAERAVFTASRPVCRRTRRALPATLLPGTDLSTFPPTAGTPFTCWPATGRAW
jgi:hypothetical protein